MKCERCGKETDVIKHIGTKGEITFSFNGYKDAMVCVECWNNKPELNICYEIEEIRNA